MLSDKYSYMHMSHRSVIIYIYNIIIIFIVCVWVFCWKFYLVFGLRLPALLSDSYLAYSNIFQHFFALLKFLNKLAISGVLFGIVFGSGAPRACKLTVVCGSALPRENLRAGVAVPARACHVKRRWTSQSATPATQSAATCRQVPRLPRKKPRRPRRLLGTERATRASPGPYVPRLPR
jgi:hypothetical protein